MKTKKQKGFTLVELVIVIAVIAILAAVLIPTFSSLVKKANESADIQAARQMNTHLALEAATEDMTITNVYEALLEGGMTAKDYHPLIKDRFYFWDSELNRVLYTDENYNVLYPENSKTEKENWYSLSGEIKGDDTYTKTTDENNETTITVESGAQLYQAVQDLEYSGTIKLNTSGTKNNNFEHSISKNTVINITEDINMMGGTLTVGAVCNGVTLTINGNNHTISNISNLDNAVNNIELNAEGKKRNYYIGIVQYVDDNANVTFKDINFDGIVAGKENVGSSGLLVGNIRNKVSLTFENVAISNSTLYGKNKLGAFVGGVAYSTSIISIKGTKTKLENVNIIASEGEAGILFGSTSNSGTDNNVKIDSKIENSSQSFITNCSVVCTSTNTKAATPAEGFNSTLDGKIAKKIDATDTDVADDYRVTTAYYGFAPLSSGTKYTGTGSTFNPINTYEQAVKAGWIYNFDTSTVVTE